jgi:hypothetical protein
VARTARTARDHVPIAGQFTFKGGAKGEFLLHLTLSIFPIFCPSGQTSADETASAMFRRVATAEAPGIIARRLAPSESTMNPAVALLVILDTLFFAVAWNGSRAKRCSRPRQICDQ